ncbi:MAG: sensor histidine kinase N-terminal domain-containing protein [Planctomycetes bacterium]|nr:sensor histidine kinase N-terminal domain-containing protein [Planctomycetota bacterium]
MGWPQPRTIRARITTGAALLLFVALTLAGFALSTETREIALRGLDRRLHAEAEALAGLVHFDGRAVSIDRPEDAAREYGKLGGRAYFQIWNGKEAVARSRSLGDFRLPRPDPGMLRPLETVRNRRTDRDFAVGPDGERLRMLTFVVARTPWESDPARDVASSASSNQEESALVAVQVARSLDDVAHAVEELRGDLFVALPLAWLVGCVGVFLLASRALRPIARMSADAAAIAAGREERRLDAVRVESELSDLAKTLNAAFDRLAQTIERERHFSADAAHELRTPIAVLRACIEVALTKPRDAYEDEVVLRDTLTHVLRLNRIVDDLLLLARFEHAEALDQQVDLRSAVLASVDLARAAEPAGAAGIRVDLGDEPLLVAGSSSLLERVASNLIANALVHGASPHGIDVRAHRVATEAIAELVVADRGPGIPPELGSHAFERFRRGDASRSRASGGTGLGLAIVAAVVALHRGTVSHRPRGGGGTEFVVRLPLSTVAA